MPYSVFFLKAKAIFCTFKIFPPTFYAGSHMVMVLVRCWLGTLPTNPSLLYRACLKMCSNTFFCNLALLSHLQPPWQCFVNDFRAVCGCASLSQGKNIVTATEAALWCHSCAHKKSHNGVALVWPNLISGLPPPPPQGMCYIWHST